MKYLKKMALALALVAGLCGGAWAQNYRTAGYAGYGPYGEAREDYQLGYRDGLEHGRADRRTGRKYQPTHYPSYKHGNQAYRDGFAAGYNEGYYRGR